MLGYDVKKSIYDLIPVDYTVRGFTVHVAKRYANQFVADVFPAITLKYAMLGVESFRPLDNIRNMVQITKDTNTYTTGTTKYDLEIERTDEIKKVWGVVAGASYVFDPIEYQLLTLTNELEFLGPNYPDDGSTFYVRYHHDLIRVFLGGEFYDLVSFSAWADDEYIDAATSTRINGIVIAEKVANDLRKFMMYNLDVNGTVITNASLIRDLDDLAGAEYHRRRQFDLRVRHTEMVEIQIENIKEVDWAVKKVYGYPL